ncbi:MAG: magnesium and cobalt transport protein CorA [Proteobacteria bacterium]|nr:MAG: magnesium and cobalt transport protein CorA [Pseudomonadota bacterium]
MRIAGTAELFARRTPPPGTRPGGFVVPPDSHPTGTRVFHYGDGHCAESTIAGPDDLATAIAGDGVTWIDVEGLGDGSILHWLRDAGRVHALAVADIAHTGQRPKFEDYGDRDLIIAQAIETSDGDGIVIEQVSLIVGAGFVVSVTERPMAIFDPVRERIRTGTATICRMGSDFLAYALLDAVIDGYFPVVEEIGEVLNDLEEEITERASEATLRHLHAVRRTLLAVHRVMYRHRDALGTMMRAEEAPFTAPVRVYLRDAYDHALQVLDTVETYRDMAIGLTDVYLSSISNRLNEVMKTLTIVSTIFIPLSFIAGVYGMNFEFMPELRWRLGYPFALALMTGVAGGLLYSFWRRGWLRRRRRADDDESDAKR